jgi:hypothetical protein
MRSAANVSQQRRRFKRAEMNARLPAEMRTLSSRLAMHARDGDSVRICTLTPFFWDGKENGTADSRGRTQILTG